MADRTTTGPRHEHPVIGVVSGLVRELESGRAPRQVGPDSLLDKDLGIGSLERVELLLRIETACAVRLADHVMANALSVGDLVRAVDAGAAPAAEPTSVDSAAEQGAGHVAPASLTNLVDVLRWHVDRTPDRVHLFLREDDGKEYRVTYGGLWAESEKAAAGLRALGVAPGDRVAVLLRTERAFFTTYVGILMAGAVPVPLYPPFRADQILDYATRQAAILNNAETKVLVTFERAEGVARLLKPLAPSLTSVVTADDLTRTPASGHAARVTADTLALIQYTSGSTGHPKGVALSHANLMTNIRAFGEALDVRSDDVGVSWLPLYHDMGLIGMWLGSLFHGLPVVVMSPLAFLSRPSRWLKAFHTHRGTISAAPNFAYDLCVRKVNDEEIAGLDLSSWRAALNGAEAVSADTIARFTARFGRYGLKANAICPVYGLAEASLCLTVPRMDAMPSVDRVARGPFQQAREIRPAEDDEPALTFVGCGAPIRTTDVRIVDTGGRALGDRVEGRIQFRGPSATNGYFRNLEATRALFQDGWLQTGDLGYWRGGELYITGRHKDVIIAGGRNIYPQEIEEAVGDIPGIRRGCVAAFGSVDAAVGTERLVVVAESRERDDHARGALEATVIACIVDILGVPPDGVVLVRPGCIPKTSSGKIRRSTTRELYEQGRLRQGRAGAAVQWGQLIAKNVTWRARLLASRARWALFTGYLWLLMGIAALVLRGLLFFVRDAGTGGAISRAWCRTLFRLGTFRVTYGAIEPASGDHGTVYVANHASYLDALLLRAALPASVRMAAKGRLLSYPFVGALIGGSNVMTVTRGRESSADHLVAVARTGGAFAIFPEGTFMRAPGLLPFRLGAFRAAVEAKCPVVPVALVGTRRAWPDETWLIRRVRLEVRVGEPIWPQGDGWREIVRLRDAARAFLARETGESAFVDHNPESQARASGRDPEESGVGAAPL